MRFNLEFDYILVLLLNVIFEVHFFLRKVDNNMENDFNIIDFGVRFEI